MTLWEIEMEDRPETVGRRLAMWEGALWATGPCDREAAEHALRGLYHATPVTAWSYTFVSSPAVMLFAGGFAAGIRNLHATGAVHYVPGVATPTVYAGLERAAHMAARAVVEQCPVARAEEIAGAIIAAVYEVTNDLRWPEPDQVGLQMVRSCLGEELGAMVDGVIAGDSVPTGWPMPQPGFGGLATHQQRMAVLLDGEQTCLGWDLPLPDAAPWLAGVVYDRVDEAMVRARAMACAQEERGGPSAEHAGYLLRCAVRCVRISEQAGACGIFPVFESACILHEHRTRGVRLRLEACRHHHELAMATGPQFHHEGLSILCDRPVELHVPDSARSSRRPYMRWSDGTFT